MKTSDFDYSLPSELIAQTPVEPRDHSRLMVVNRSNGSVEHKRFFEITEYLKAGDVLVFNNSRVIPARLNGRKVDTGGKVEILLLRQLDRCGWETLVKPSKRVNIGTKIEITDNSEADNGHKVGVLAEVTGIKQDGIKVINFSDEKSLPALGRIPLPPYIHTPLDNPERYQTIYATMNGSVAAPTAGLHFTPGLLDAITKKGCRCLFVTLHVNLNTFRPVREDDPHNHATYEEYGVINKEVAAQLCQAKQEGQRIICVGTTTLRLLEQAAQSSKESLIEPFKGWVSLFILPGYQFRVVDSLTTNFHLPRTTLIMLASAFAGKALIDRVYKEAIASRYRFYSFGDAMLIL